jgi:hypothetical protein
MILATNGEQANPEFETILATTDVLTEGDVEFQFIITNDYETIRVDVVILDEFENDKTKFRIYTEAMQPVISPIMTASVLAGEKIILRMGIAATGAVQGTLFYDPAVPPPNLDPEATKVVLGAAVNCLGVADEITGEVNSEVTFNVNLSQSGATYWTQAHVTVTPADTQRTIRAKTIAAVKQQILDEFALTVNDYDVILSNYYIGI